MLNRNFRSMRLLVLSWHWLVTRPTCKKLGLSHLRFAMPSDWFCIFLALISISVLKVHSLKDAMEYAERNGMFFMETSAKTDNNINELFEVLIQAEQTISTFECHILSLLKKHFIQCQSGSYLWWKNHFICF